MSLQLLLDDTDVFFASFSGKLRYTIDWQAVINIFDSSGGHALSACFLGNIARLFIGLPIDLEDGRHWEDLQFEGERETT